MNSSSRQKRAPFGEADVANRRAMGRNDVNKRRIEPSSSKLLTSKSTSRGAPASRFPAKGSAKNNRTRSKSRPRQQLEPPQQQSPQRSIGSNDPSSDATRARVYKAEGEDCHSSRSTCHLLVNLSDILFSLLVCITSVRGQNSHRLARTANRGLASRTERGEVLPINGK